MKLKNLLQGLDVEVKGKKDVEVTGISSYSKQIGPGSVFIAKKGEKTDGFLFVEEAIDAGAVAIVTDLYNPFLTSAVTQVITNNVKSVEGELASRFYEHPTRDLFLVGITGTSGKTTTAYIIKHLLDDEGCGLISTIETVIKDHTFPSTLTTPDVFTLNKSFKEMIKKGCSSCVMEVSSHAIAQKRIDKLDYDIAVFTNLSQDHLDYHHTMENYAATKAGFFKTFTNLHDKTFPKTAVINSDDPYKEIMMQDISSELITYGIDDETAQLRADSIKMSASGTEFFIHYQGKKYLIKTGLIGRHNVYNCLAAVAVALAKGLSFSYIAQKLSSCPRIAARLEKIICPKQVYVDFAHKEGALKNVLLTLREITIGKLIVVFGCGGDRDKSKRPKIASIAEEYGDILILTSDNPRSEDPFTIIEEMSSGLKNRKPSYKVVDRKEAIHLALKMAEKDDVVLLAGKGHESTQIFKDKVVPFNDIKVALEYFKS